MTGTKPIFSLKRSVNFATVKHNTVLLHAYQITSCFIS